MGEGFASRVCVDFDTSEDNSCNASICCATARRIAAALSRVSSGRSNAPFLSSSRVSLNSWRMLPAVTRISSVAPEKRLTASSTASRNVLRRTCAAFTERFSVSLIRLSTSLTEDFNSRSIVPAALDDNVAAWVNAPSTISMSERMLRSTSSERATRLEDRRSSASLRSSIVEDNLFCASPNKSVAEDST